MIGSKVLTEPSYSTHKKEGETYDQSCISRSVFSQVNGLARYKSRYVLEFNSLVAFSLLHFESRSTQRFLCSGAESATETMDGLGRTSAFRTRASTSSSSSRSTMSGLTSSGSRESVRDAERFSPREPDPEGPGVGERDCDCG